MPTPQGLGFKNPTGMRQKVKSRTHNCCLFLGTFHHLLKAQLCKDAPHQISAPRPVLILHMSERQFVFCKMPENSIPGFRIYRLYGLVNKHKNSSSSSEQACRWHQATRGDCGQPGTHWAPLPLPTGFPHVGVKEASGAPCRAVPSASSNSRFTPSKL